MVCQRSMKIRTKCLPQFREMRELQIAVPSIKRPCSLVRWTLPIKFYELKNDFFLNTIVKAYCEDRKNKRNVFTSEQEEHSLHFYFYWSCMCQKASIGKAEQNIHLFLFRSLNLEKPHPNLPRQIYIGNS